MLSIHPGEIQGRLFDLISAGTFAVDQLVSDASVDDYDALLLPGGVVNPDALRINMPVNGVAALGAHVDEAKQLDSTGDLADRLGRTAQGSRRAWNIKRGDEMVSLSS